MYIKIHGNTRIPKITDRLTQLNVQFSMGNYLLSTKLNYNLIYRNFNLSRIYASRVKLIIKSLVEATVFTLADN